jgi:large subunit ribosomal protein L24
MNGTINPGKQRKAVYEADLRLQGTNMSAHLSKELRTRHGARSVPVRVGDTVKIMRGDYVGKTGNINQVDRKRNKVYIQGVMRKKTDGKEAFLAFRPSNLLITALDAKDKKRFKKSSTKQAPAKHPEKVSAAGKKE